MKSYDRLLSFIKWRGKFDIDYKIVKNIIIVRTNLLCEDGESYICLFIYINRFTGKIKKMREYALNLENYKYYEFLH